MDHSAWPPEVADAAAWLRSEIGEPLPRIAIVLGSGLGAFAKRVAPAVSIEVAAVPHWPPVTVIGHAGRIVVGTIGEQRVLVLSGRVHYYEGQPMSAVTFPVRVVAALGVSVLVLTNAAGGINPRFHPGTLMLITDHVSLFIPNPLIGANDDRLGPRFPDMSQVYSPRLAAIARDAARAAGVPLDRGIYAAVTGPSYETPADIRALRALGADAVGMSTVPEAIAARHLGLEILGVSCIANAAAGMRAGQLSAADVLNVTRATETTFATLMEAILARL